MWLPDVMLVVEPVTDSKPFVLAFSVGLWKCSLWLVQDKEMKQAAKEHKKLRVTEFMNG
jgi:hypothetical protein